jgi:rRNA processing protein Krr1/Pno1
MLHHGRVGIEFARTAVCLFWLDSCNTLIIGINVAIAVTGMLIARPIVGMILANSHHGTSFAYMYVWHDCCKCLY